MVKTSLDSGEMEDIIDAETPHALIVEELEENKRLQDEIELGRTEKPKDFELPSTKFFSITFKREKNQKYLRLRLIEK